MFSFFKSKKPSPDHTPAEPIPGPIPPAPKEDDFIFVERKGSVPSPSSGSANELSPSQGGLYPSIPEASGSNSVSPVRRQHSDDKAAHHHVLHGVPFKLSPELARDNNHLEVTQYHANEVLSFITRTATVRVEYDFSLERSVLYEG